MPGHEVVRLGRHFSRHLPIVQRGTVVERLSYDAHSSFWPPENASGVTSTRWFGCATVLAPSPAHSSALLPLVGHDNVPSYLQVS